MDICFLTCICLWQISQIQTFLFRVVGPGLVSASPAFVSNSASHPAGPHGRHAQKTVNQDPHCWGRGGSTQFAQQLEFAVTAPPLVDCVVWSRPKSVSISFRSGMFVGCFSRALFFIQFHAFSMGCKSADKLATPRSILVCPP